MLLPRTTVAPLPPPAPMPKYLARLGAGEGRSLKLKSLLLRHNLFIAHLAREVLQSSGRPMSRPAMQALITYGVAPATTPLDVIELQTFKWLADKGVPQDEINTAFELEDAVVAKWAHARHNPDNATGASRYGVAHSPRTFIPPEKAMLTADAKRHFKLTADPFGKDPQNLNELFLGADQRAVLEAMWQCVRNAGFVVVIGEVGAGKSVLRQELEERMKSDRNGIAVIKPEIVDNARLTSEMITHAIVRDLDPTAKMPQRLGDQTRLAKKLLIERSASGVRHVLLIEETQDVTKKMLKELKRFSEWADGRRRVLAILLLGQNELKRVFDLQKNFDAREVIERIDVVDLPPLHGQALQAYVEHKAKVAGTTFAALFDADALDAIRNRLIFLDDDRKARSYLYPLLIDNLIVDAANGCAALGVPRINADAIKSLGVR